MFVRIVAFAAALALLAGTTTAQDKKKGGAPNEKDMMEAMAKMSAPGEQHKVLASLAGKWTYAQTRSRYNVAWAATTRGLGRAAAATWHGGVRASAAIAVRPASRRRRPSSEVCVIAR